MLRLLMLAVTAALAYLFGTRTGRRRLNQIATRTRRLRRHPRAGTAASDTDDDRPQPM